MNKIILSYKINSNVLFVLYYIITAVKKFIQSQAATIFFIKSVAQLYEIIFAYKLCFE